MVLKSYKKCIVCNFIVYYKENVCPMCDGVCFQNNVSDIDFLNFLIDLNELPVDATIDDLRHYFIKVINDEI